MLPTLNFCGDFLHINKFNRRGNNFHVGYMIVAAKATDQSPRVCRGITGIPGDNALIDNEEAPSTDIYSSSKCWVTGDNLSQRLDSLSYVELPLALIRGKVFVVHDSSGEFRRIENF
jgi:signal peptidase I